MKTSTTDNNKTTEQKDTAILHSSYIHTDGPILLKTAVAEIQSNSTSCDANILFDEGAQRSFTIEKIAKRLNLRPTGIETHYLSGFGEKNRQVRHLKTAKKNLTRTMMNIPTTRNQVLHTTKMRENTILNYPGRKFTSRC
jgi:hypothetical protein